MNTRQAKKIGCCPEDPRRNPVLCTPYTHRQWTVARRVYMRALGRAPLDGRCKWETTRPTVHRSRWRPGYTGARFYGPKAQRVPS